MKFEQELIHILKPSQSKAAVDRAIKAVGSNPVCFGVLMDLIDKGKDSVVSDRAAWVLSYVCEKHPELTKGYWKRFIKLLVNPHTSVGIRRNLVRFMQVVPIPKPYCGEITHRCFELANDPSEAIAVKAFSIGILEKMVQLYPDLKQELVLTIHEILPHASAGVRNRCMKVLYRLEKN